MSEHAAITYRGRIVPADEAKPALPEAADPASQADAILAAAHAEADAIRAQKLASLDMEFERRLAERLTTATAGLGIGIRDSAQILTDILQDALETMIGDRRTPEVLHKAINAAASRLGPDHGMTVRVADEDFSRLEVVRRAYAPVTTVAIVRDNGLGRGRCVLETGGRKYEIGVQTQIEAFKKLSAKAASAVPDAETDA
ncbi:hypothetical protein CSC94_14490 [Zhengella mangrovi]|uniref:Flagellar assembly protein FliH/Type III secretion system HrpE domain-containing protein n=1 Tax=Zhengella mangrovi TaxID=1982044 RepID=A0A2G1QLT2_9HYPH|nr:hypothetical protein [Zhengella mangrovi]PHP66483.1 hypothetical protein CSC94_14490 [Zhengella mangrovi]